jgi:hypothetical protein
MNRQGSILIGVLMVIGFSLLVGVPLLQAANLEHQASINDQLDAQAFYLAEAGIEHAKAAVEPKLKDMLKLGWLPGHDLEPYLNENGALVTVSRDNFGPGDYTADVFFQLLSSSGGDFEYELSIDSKGSAPTAVGASSAVSVEKSNGISVVVTIGVGESGGNEYPPEGGDTVFIPFIRVALFASDGFTLSNNAKVEGSAGTNNADGIDGSGGQLTGDLYLYDYDEYAAPPDYSWVRGEVLARADELVFPVYQLPTVPETLPPSSRKLSVNNSSTIDCNQSYGEVALSNNSTLRINVGSGQSGLRFSSLKMGNGSKLELLGEGKLDLYIDGQVLFDNNALINSAGDEENLRLYIRGQDTVTLSNNVVFKGTLYAEKSSVRLQNNARFTGSIVTGSTGNAIVLGNNAFLDAALIYAPKAAVSLANNATVEGAVVANTCTVSNNGIIYGDVGFIVGAGEGAGTDGFTIDFDKAIWASHR